MLGKCGTPVRIIYLYECETPACIYVFVLNLLCLHYDVFLSSTLHSTRCSLPYKNTHGNMISCFPAMLLWKFYISFANNDCRVNRRDRGNEHGESEYPVNFRVWLSIWKISHATSFSGIWICVMEKYMMGLCETVYVATSCGYMVVSNKSIPIADCNDQLP